MYLGVGRGYATPCITISRPLGPIEGVSKTRIPADRGRIVSGGGPSSHPSRSGGGRHVNRHRHGREREGAGRRQDRGRGQREGGTMLGSGGGGDVCWGRAGREGKSACVGGLVDM